MARIDVEVKKITVDEEDILMKGRFIYGRTEKFIKLGINSEKSVTLLNRMLLWKYDSCNEKIRPRYTGVEVDRLVGGGILVKAMSSIGVTQAGEVGIFFKRWDRSNNFIKYALGEFETIKAIKDRIANELKKFWTAHRKNDNDEIQIGELKFSTPEYRVLYEVLKSRDEKKIKAKYGTAVYNEMIGKKIDDQFILAAIEILRNEIARTIEEKNTAIDVREQEFEAERDQVYKSWKNDKERIEFEANEKIASYEEQIKIMMNNAFA